MIDINQTVEHLDDHLTALTVTIGERSVRRPENITKAATYIKKFYQSINLEVTHQTYHYQQLSVANVVTSLTRGPSFDRHYIVGAHYDSVAGTVGADDNASAVAVQLETARHLKRLQNRLNQDVKVTFVSFALEEPPVYGTRYMGSRVYAAAARKAGQRIDGMICLEMVGYTCHEPGCQRYPFPLMLGRYPKQGNFIGIVGNGPSRGLTKKLKEAFRGNAADLPVITLNVPFSGYLMPSVRLSDHAAFWDQGYPAVMVTDTAFFRNPHYHQATDTKERLDLRFMAELVESLVFFFSQVQR